LKKEDYLNRNNIEFNTENIDELFLRQVNLKLKFNE
jgi:hypothetical protein